MRCLGFGGMVGGIVAIVSGCAVKGWLGLLLAGVGIVAILVFAECAEEE